MRYLNDYLCLITIEPPLRASSDYTIYQVGAMVVVCPVISSCTTR